MNWLARHTIIIFLFVTSLTNIQARALPSCIEILEVQHTQEVCNLGNGTITIIVNNPDASTLYSVDNGINFQTSNYFDNLQSGDYLILVVNGSGCSETMSVQIVNAPEPEVTLDINCINGMNMVNINLTPFQTGIFPFTYNWIGPDSTLYQTQDISNVSPGSYSVSVTDRLGCEIDTTFTIMPCCELQISCASDSVYLECLSALPEIPSAFLDQFSVNLSDQIKLEEMGITVEGMCNEVWALMEEDQSNPVDCTTEDLEITRTLTVHDGVSSVTCRRHYFIGNYNNIEVLEQPQDITIACSENVDSLLNAWIMENGYARFRACSNPEITHLPSDAEPEYTCPGSGLLEVRFIASDACNNPVERMASFRVVDDVPPNLICPPSGTIDVRSDTLNQYIADWLSLAQADDLCSTSAIAHDYGFDDYTNICKDTTILVTFIASDECQNTSTCQTDLTLNFLLDPVLECPDDLVIACNNTDHTMVISEWLEAFRATAGNDALGIVLDDTINPAMALNCEEEIVLTASLEDVCLASVSCQRSIIVSDQNAPDISCPEELVVDSRDPEAEQMVLDWLLEASAQDDCSNVAVAHDFQNLAWENICYTTEIEVQFSAVDNCLNENQCTSLLTIEADENIYFNCPDDLVITCSQYDPSQLVDDWLQLFEAGIGTDHLSVDIQNTFTGSLPLPCQGSYELIAEVNDPCAQGLRCIRQIIVSDNSAPEINCPPSLTVNSRDINIDTRISDWLNEPLTTDDCDNAVISHDYNALNWLQLCDSQSIPVLFIASDLCGNTNQCESMIHVELDNNFSISCPDNLILTCRAAEVHTEIEAWLQNFQAYLGTEPSTTDIQTSYTSSHDFACLDVIPVYCLVNHPCAEGLSCEREIIMQDDTPPQVNCPEDLTVNNRDPNIGGTIDQWLNDAQSFDDCDIVQYDHDYTPLDWPSYCNDQELTVTFTSTDECNNTSTCTAQLIVKAPSIIVLNCPDDITIDCLESDYHGAIANWLNTFDARIDNSMANVGIRTGYNDQTTMGCNDIISLEAFIEDDCAMEQACTRFIKVNDNTPPEIICPPDLTVDPRNPNLEEILSDWLMTASASDDCNEVSVGHDYQDADWFTICDPISYSVSFNTTDNCQNSNECRSTIFVEPDFDMEIICPDNLVISCVDSSTKDEIDLWIAGFAAQDRNMPLSVNVSTNYNVLNEIHCGDLFEFNCTVTDPCDEGLECWRTIEVIDNEEPEISCPPMLTINTLNEDPVGEAENWLGQFESNDNCRLAYAFHDLEVSILEDICNVENDIDVYFQAEDECGNTAVCASKIIIEYIDIEISCPPSIIVECNNGQYIETAETWLGSAQSVDMLGNNYTVEQSLDIASLEPGCDRPYEVVFSASDVCGKLHECSSEIRLIDSTAPQITCPEARYIDVSSANALNVLDTWLTSCVAIDECHAVEFGTNFNIDIREVVCEETFLVEFNAVDECDNSTSCVTELTLDSPGYIELWCPESIVDIPCFDIPNGMIQTFLSGYEVSSVYDYTISNNFNLQDIDMDCEDEFELEVSFLAQDICGNASSCHTQLSFLPEAKIYIPNIFSPVLESSNRWFTVFGNISVTSVREMVVFDRWGSPVFEKSDFPHNQPEEGWDGYKGNEMLHGQVFSYYIQVEDVFGFVHEKTGTVQMVR